MKTIIRCLKKLEDEFTPKGGAQTPLADLIRAARRRRLEAQGERYEELPPVSRFDEQGNRRTLGQIILAARRQREAREARAARE